MPVSGRKVHVVQDDSKQRRVLHEVTAIDVQAALVEAMDLWRRTPAAMKLDVKTSGIWAQMLQRTDDGDHDGRGADMIEPTPRPLPLSRDEVWRRDAITEWYLDIPKADDRRLVAAAVGYLYRGYQRVPWLKIKHRMGIKFGTDGLRKRYSKAIFAICQAESRRIAKVEHGKG
jgi:hypothetical protein